MDRGSWRAIVPRITRVGHDNALSFSERRLLYWALKDFLGKKDERNGQSGQEQHMQTSRRTNIHGVLGNGCKRGCGSKSQLGQDHEGPALPRCSSRDTGEQPRKGGDLLGLESLGKWRQRHCIKFPDERKQSCVLRWWRQQQQGWQ